MLEADAEVEEETEEEAEELVLPHLSLARTENWVEYWNSPVPSTMISMPYPVSVAWVPAGRSQATVQEILLAAAGTPSMRAVLSGTQLEEGPRQRTRLTVTPSVGCDSGSQVTSYVSPWVTGEERSGFVRGPQEAVVGGVKARTAATRPPAMKRERILMLEWCSRKFDLLSMVGITIRR